MLICRNTHSQKSDFCYRLLREYEMVSRSAPIARPAIGARVLPEGRLTECGHVTVLDGTATGRPIINPSRRPVRMRIRRPSIPRRPDLEQIVPAFRNPDGVAGLAAADRQADHHRLPLRDLGPWRQVDQLDRVPGAMHFVEFEAEGTTGARVFAPCLFSLAPELAPLVVVGIGIFVAIGNRQGLKRERNTLLAWTKPTI